MLDLRKRGLRLMLDFVPNHTALDHPWTEDHPEFYFRGFYLDVPPWQCQILDMIAA